MTTGRSNTPKHFVETTLRNVITSILEVDENANEVVAKHIKEKLIKRFGEYMSNSERAARELQVYLRIEACLGQGLADPLPKREQKGIRYAITILSGKLDNSESPCSWFKEDLMPMYVGVLRKTLKSLYSGFWDEDSLPACLRDDDEVGESIVRRSSSSAGAARRLATFKRPRTSSRGSADAALVENKKPTRSSSSKYGINLVKNGKLTTNHFTSNIANVLRRRQVQVRMKSKPKERLRGRAYGSALSLRRRRIRPQPLLRWSLHRTRSP